MTAQWVLEKKATVTDPDIETFDLNHNFFPLRGDQSIWNIKILINNTLINIADIYLPECFASYLHIDTPIVISQLYSGMAEYSALLSHRKNIEYTEISLENEFGENSCITDFEIIKTVECLLNDDELLYGWSLENNAITAVGGDISYQDAIRTVGYTFEDIYADSECSLDNVSTSTDNIFDSQIKIYPNPTTNFISIRTVDNEILNIIIRDISGKEILTSDSSEPINIMSFHPGVYIIEIINKTNTSKTIKKIIKQ